MGETGKYIYGIINSNSAFRLFVRKNFQQNGNNEIVGVYSISEQDICAVVSDSEIIDCTHLLKDDLARLLLDHQRVIEKIMDLGCSVIPMRLGTVVLDEAEVKNILGKGYSLIKEISQRVENKVEIDVVAVLGDFSLVLNEISQEKEIREFKERLLANPKGITNEDQMLVGIMVKKALDGKRENYALRIQNALTAVSEDFRVHGLMDDKMVANFAFLIDKTKRVDFDKRIEDLNKEFEEKLNFRSVGPLPPYSFCSLEVKKLKFEEINLAKERLGISNKCVDREEIKKAYQRQAFSFHPDRNPEVPDIEKKFDEIKNSYNALLEYCQSYQQHGQTNLSFSEEEFEKNAILVRLKE